jgi:flagellar hook-associated protein 1 FlgK
MDLDQQLGSDIFSRPEFVGLGDPNNSGTDGLITGRVVRGGAGEVTSADYLVTINSVTAGAPSTLDVTISAVNPDGTAVTDVNGLPISQNYPTITAQPGTFTEVLGGLELEFADGAGYTAGNEFLLQPTKNSGDKIEVIMTRPEDLALAAPVRIDSNNGNLGDAKLVSTVITNTFVDNTFADSRTSAFNDAGGLQGPGAAPGGGVGAPAEIRFTASNEYEVLDSAGSVITVVSGATDLNNLLAQAKGSGAGPAWPAAFSALNDYPGFDLSLEGIPKPGDSFSIGYNTDGLNDNRNGLELSDLQNKDIMQSNKSSSGTLFSFTETYSKIVSDIGRKSASADISLQAAKALKSQSNNWFESVSGVSLDEEAANLVKFQQSYSASARLLATAQDLFNTILGITR